eukprot:5235943-Pleurochrysis_carterae.AAC.2
MSGYRRDGCHDACSDRRGASQQTAGRPRWRRRVSQRHAKLVSPRTCATAGTVAQHNISVCADAMHAQKREKRTTQRNVTTRRRTENQERTNGIVCQNTNCPELNSGPSLHPDHRNPPITRSWRNPSEHSAPTAEERDGLQNKIEKLRRTVSLIRGPTTPLPIPKHAYLLPTVTHQGHLVQVTMFHMKHSYDSYSTHHETRS